MPAPRILSEEELDWLTTASEDGTTIREMAMHFRCCEDTIKRLLTAHGLANYKGMKYQPARNDTKTWNRPCSGCGSTKARPRHQFYCVSCQEKRGFATSSPYAFMSKVGSVIKAVDQNKYDSDLIKRFQQTFADNKQLNVAEGITRPKRFTFDSDYGRGEFIDWRGSNLGNDIKTAKDVAAKAKESSQKMHDMTQALYEYAVTQGLIEAQLAKQKAPTKTPPSDPPISTPERDLTSTDVWCA